MIIKEDQFFSGKIRSFFEKLIGFLTEKPIFSVIFIVLLCSFLGVLFFYRYVLIPAGEDFVIKEQDLQLNLESYENIVRRWDIEEKRIETIERRRYQNIFLPKGEDAPSQREEDISPQELEDILSNTLYEFYSLRGDHMPPIEERALIWEELGLGKAQEYRGYYFQNVIFLNFLLDKMEEGNEVD